MIIEGIILGHIFLERGIEVDKAKIKIIENLQPPKIVREVQCFLGHTVSTNVLSRTSLKLQNP